MNEDGRRMNPMQLKRQRQMNRRLKSQQTPTVNPFPIKQVPLKNLDLQMLPANGIVSMDDDDDEMGELPYPTAKSNMTMDFQPKGESLAFKVDQMYLNSAMNSSVPALNGNPINRIPNQLEMESLPPMDWNLNSQFVVLSTFPCPSLRPKVSMHENNPPDASTTPSMIQQWNQSCQYWIHQPIVPLTTLSTLHWQEALRSAYYTLIKSKRPQSFYVYNKQCIIGFYQNCSQVNTLHDHLVDHVVTENQSSIYAVVSRSTASMRTVLQEQKVLFSMPLDTSCNTNDSTARPDPEQEELVEELKRFESATSHIPTSRVSLPTTSSIKSPTQSLLLLASPLATHALYDLLLNSQIVLPSVPSQTSRTLPFIGAVFAFHQSTQKQLRVLQRPLNKNTLPKHQILYRTEISTPDVIFPAVLPALCQVLQGQCIQPDCAFTIHTFPYKNGVSMNVKPVCEDTPLLAVLQQRISEVSYHGASLQYTIKLGDTNLE